MANRKTISFGVSEETFNLIKSNVPNGTCDEALLLAMFDAYQNKGSENVDNSELLNCQRAISEFANYMGTNFDCGVIDITKDEDLNSFFGFINNLVATRKMFERMQTVPTLDAPIVKEICEVLNIENILQAPEAIISLNQRTYDKGIQIFAHPFILELLEVTCEKLTVKFGREVTPAMVLQDMFTRYTLEQLNEWFYPFVLREPAIMAIAKKHYPQLESYSQLKKLVCGHE